MSTNRVAIAESVETDYESLTERIARRPLSVGEILRYATPIAGSLRDLHMHGLVYGAVSSQLILLGSSGAELRKSGGLARLGDAYHDVTAFGEVLCDMLHGGQGREDLRREIRALAMRCRHEATDMQRVLIDLRLLGLKARHVATMRKPTPALCPEAARPESEEPLRRRLALHWRPLANLAAFALSGK